MIHRFFPFAATQCKPSVSRRVRNRHQARENPWHRHLPQHRARLSQLSKLQGYKRHQDLHFRWLWVIAMACIHTRFLSTTDGEWSGQMLRTEHEFFPWFTYSASYVNDQLINRVTVTLNHRDSRNIPFNPITTPTHTDPDSQYIELYMTFYSRRSATDDHICFTSPCKTPPCLSLPLSHALHKCRDNLQYQQIPIIRLHK